MKRLPLTRSVLAFVALSLPAMAAETPALYATPQDAYDAMLDSMLDPDANALLHVFGTDAEDVLSTGNQERDQENRAQILEMMTEGFRFQNGPDGDVTLLLGAGGWPFPIPLARTDDGWLFDIPAGRDEIYYRRIGLNEIDTIEIMEAYTVIQQEFRLVDHDGDGVMEFAGSLMSSGGDRDGLFWGDEEGPLGARIALASLDGYNDGVEDQAPEPFGGYYYRILQAQGDAAPGGARPYMINGNMVSGHALLAVPSDYGDTGIHSFMVTENGVVLQADLGDDSLDIGFDMMLFNPDAAWTPVE